MERERWVEIETLLQSALDQPAAARQDFLQKACGADDDLRTEVQSLLGSGKNDSEKGDFLEVPALNIAARSLAAEKKSFVGTLIGPYRIIKPIGAGGMGEVFLAHDTRLGRQIALKILPSEFAADASRVQRFELEARAASALNHPNVLVVHDVGVHNGLPFIASEYLQGETLRDRLTSTFLPRSKAIEFGVQIARALAVAHENGIIHRDLKPENIFVTAEGRIKILDFGLAKLVGRPGGREWGAVGLSGNPASALTSPGIIMGTVSYLAPEQIRGHEAIRSSDIFAFGCVLYEMLTGRRAFSKESNAETMAAILREEPPYLETLSRIPPALLRTLRHCLEKSPSERFHSASDLAFALEGCLSLEHEPLPSQPPKQSELIWHSGWIAVGLLALSLLTFSWLTVRKSPEAPTARLEIPIPGEPATGSPALAISPDGKHLAFLAAAPDGKPIIWTRSLDSLALTPVPGSEEAQYPFWSPDSRYLAFHVGDKLKALEIATGGQRTICTIRGTVNGTWNSDGVIILSTGSGPLYRVQADGENLIRLTALDSSAGQRGHWWPSFLPDNRHFLYTVNASTSENNAIVVGSLERPNNKSDTKILISGINTNATYLFPGYLLYTRDRNLFARPFNPSRLEFTGAEVPVIDKLRAYYGYRAFSASQTGTLIYRSGDQSRFKLAWFSRSGTPLDSVTQGGQKSRETEGVLPLAPSLSPAGDLLATVRYQASDGAYGIWVSALTRSNIEYPVTITRNAEYPVWSPDETRIAYSASPNGGARDLLVKRLNEAGAGSLITAHTSNDKWPLDWSSDGQNLLLFLMNDDQGRPGLWVTPVDGHTPPTPVPGTPTDIKEARFSPDGHWLAYSSDQSGTSIVYLQDFPKGESRIPISDRGATNPIWRRDGNELFFLSSQSELMSVSIRQTNGLSAGSARLLFKTSSVGVNPYSVTPDGQRFLLQLPAGSGPIPVIDVALNWAQSLKK